MEKVKILRGISAGKKLPAAFKAAALQLTAAALSFSLGKITDGGSAGFILGFLCGLPQEYLLSAAIGGSLGFYFNFSVIEALKNIAACCIAAFIRLGAERRTSEKRRMLYAALLAFFSYFLPSAAVFAAAGYEITYFIKCTGEAAAAAAFACFTVRSTEALKAGRQGAFFSPADISAFMITGAVLLLGISRFQIRGFSAGRSLACFSVMLLSLSDIKLLPSAAGAVCALAFGFGSAETDLTLPFLAGGIACGVCSDAGKWASVSAYLLSSLFALIISGNTEGLIINLAETAAAGLIFLIIPSRRLKKLLNAFTLSGIKKYEEEKTRFIELRLRRTAAAVKDIAVSASAAAGYLVKNGASPEVNIPESVREDVCSECAKKDFCWAATGKITMQAFENAASVMIKKGSLKTEDLPGRLNLICRKNEALTDSFNRCYYENAARIAAKREINEAKLASASVFGISGGLLEYAASKIAEAPPSDPDMAAAASGVFREYGMDIINVSAVKLKNGRCIIEALLRKAPEITDENGLLNRLFDVTGEAFEPPVSDRYIQGGTVLSFTTAAEYGVEYAQASHLGAGESFSGDTAECFFDGRGNFFTVLSDGMGTGSRAAVDSVMTSSLMSRLIRAGFSADAALTAVNCALMIKSADETLSTLDILKIELDTGKAYFYKAGAGASVISKGGRTISVEKSSMPLGILPEAKLEKGEISLEAGDRVLIMSDGASVIPQPEFKDMFRDKSLAEPQMLADRAVDRALSLSPSGKNDDITVICIQIEKSML